MNVSILIKYTLILLFMIGCNTSSFKGDNRSKDPAKGDEPYPKVQDPVQDDPTQDDPTQDDPTQDDPKQDDPTQDDPKQDDPTQDDPTQEPTEPYPGKDKTTKTTIETPIEIVFECDCTPGQNTTTQQDPGQNPTQQAPGQNTEDPTQNPGQYIIKTPPKYGKITIININIVIYTPNPGYHGIDTFTYVPKDKPDGKPATVTVAVTNQKLLISDDFERAKIIEHANFHWLQLIRDKGELQNEQNECVNKICGKIVKEGTLPDQNNNVFGPTPNGQHSLLFYGRHGQSIHNVYLISKFFNLAQFHTVKVSFDYLLMDLGEFDTLNGHPSVDEFLKFEVCVDSMAGCGVQPIDGDRLDSASYWRTIVTKNEPTSFNGRNHSLGDWKRLQFTFDLKSLEASYPNFSASEFSFRFNTRLTDGFKDDNLGKTLVDGTMIDNVVIEAIGDNKWGKTEPY